jgi:hypothetical protein
LRAKNRALVVVVGASRAGPLLRLAPPGGQAF